MYMFFSLFNPNGNLVFSILLTISQTNLVCGGKRTLESHHTKYIVLKNKPKKFLIFTQNEHLFNQGFHLNLKSIFFLFI